MDPSLVVLLCVFTVAVVASVGTSSWMWSQARRSSQEAAKLLSSAVEACRSLEQTVAQRSSMADEVAALRQPLTESAVKSVLLTEALNAATKELAGNLVSIPKMIEVMTELAKGEVQILEQIKSTADSLYSSLHSKDPRANYRPYDAASADREYAIAELQRTHGITRKEAEENVNSDRLWQGMSLSR